MWENKHRLLLHFDAKGAFYYFDDGKGSKIQKGNLENEVIYYFLKKYFSYNIN